LIYTVPHEIFKTIVENDNRESPESVVEVDYKVTYRCFLLNSLMETCKFFSLLYLMLLIWWLYHHFMKRSTTRTMLHKILISLPILRLLYTIMNYFFFKICPWENFMTDTYIKLMRIILNLLYQSLLVGTMVLAAQGFKIARRDITRVGLVNVLVAMVVDYFVVFIFFFFSSGLNFGTIIYLFVNICIPILCICHHMETRR
jgi:hypothetical protein